MSSSSLTTTSRSSVEAESVEEFDTRLSLGLGGGGGGGSWQRRPRPVVLFGELLPPPEKKLKAEAAPAREDGHRHGHTTSGKRDQRGGVASTRQEKSKKARTAHGDGDRRSPSGGDGGEDDGARKKLRLTREQATLLEDSFHAHNILSHAQKHDLARQVGLSARQVEVWFQNRRARTKLKQTEADCELLRRWCERLADENARLRHELAGLRSSTLAAPVSRLVCPSCSGDDKRRLGFVNAAGGGEKAN
ncbi:hypothetical protein ABZP36_023662 [Zizania latifolia]